MELALKFGCALMGLAFALPVGAVIYYGFRWLYRVIKRKLIS